MTKKGSRWLAWSGTGWPRLWRERSRSDTIIDRSRRSPDNTTQTFPDTEPLSKVGPEIPLPVSLRSYAVGQSQNNALSVGAWSAWGVSGERGQTEAWSAPGGSDISGPGDICRITAVSSPRPLQQLIRLGLALVCSLQGPLSPLAGHIQEPEVNKTTKCLIENLETNDLLSESNYTDRCCFSLLWIIFPLKFICMKFASSCPKEREIWLSNCKTFIFILQFVLSWSYLEDRWALALGHVMCNAASVRPGLCNAV